MLGTAAIVPGIITCLAPVVWVSPEKNTAAPTFVAAYTILEEWKQSFVHFC